MKLDLRVPMGLLFLIVGVLLTVFGAATRGSAIYVRSAGVDINLVWGLVMLVFGTTIFLLGRKSDRQPVKLPLAGTRRPSGRNGV